MKISKKVLIISGLSILAISLMSFVGTKKAQAEEVFKNIIFKVVNIKKTDLNWTRLRFYFDLMLTNPTANDFTFSSVGAIKGKAYRVFKGSELLVNGTLNNISGVNLPAGGSQVFRDILVEIPLMSVGKQLFNAVGGFDGLKNMNNLKNIDYMAMLKDLRYEVDIEALGTIFTFKGEVTV